MANTNRITSESLVDLILSLKWKSDFVVHTDCYQASQVNIWRDILPEAMLEQLMGKEAGERFQIPLEAVNLPAIAKPRDVFEIKSNQFRGRKENGGGAPRMGRFYPRGLLRGISGIFEADVQPFRCVGVNNGHLKVDFNHPLAGRELHLSTVVGKVGLKTVERGGTSHDWVEILTTGPGMQARWKGLPTDYFYDAAFARSDQKPDTIFYKEPRFVQHVDETARAIIRDTYGRFLSDGMRVLDLMSSWESHIPTGLNLSRLSGLGLNHEELKKNSSLSDFVTQDLNQNPVLPFASDTFDAVINTVSVEYPTDPLSIFREVSRILRPDGYFIITFSNRWFPTKAIHIWQDLHEFERVGLVMEYFIRSNGFKDLQTYSMRGLPRPHSDKYFPELMFSDPVYAVWGRKK